MISFLYKIPNCTEEQQYIVLLGVLQLLLTAVHFSKQNSAFVADFNLNVKIYAASSSRSATGLIAFMSEDGYVAAKKDKNSKMLLKFCIIIESIFQNTFSTK